MAGMLRVPRSRGVLSGVLLLLLGFGAGSSVRRAVLPLCVHSRPRLGLHLRTVVAGDPARPRDRAWWPDRAGERESRRCRVRGLAGRTRRCLVRGGQDLQRVAGDPPPAGRRWRRATRSCARSRRSASSPASASSSSSSRLSPSAASRSWVPGMRRWPPPDSRTAERKAGGKARRSGRHAHNPGRAGGASHGHSGSQGAHPTPDDLTRLPQGWFANGRWPFADRRGTVADRWPRARPLPSLPPSRHGDLEGKAHMADETQRPPTGTAPPLSAGRRPRGTVPTRQRVTATADRARPNGKRRMALPKERSPPTASTADEIRRRVEGVPRRLRSRDRAALAISCVRASTRGWPGSITRQGSAAWARHGRCRRSPMPSSPRRARPPTIQNCIGIGLGHGGADDPRVRLG